MLLVTLHPPGPPWDRSIFKKKKVEDSYTTPENSKKFFEVLKIVFCIKYRNLNWVFTVNDGTDFYLNYRKPD